MAQMANYEKLGLLPLRDHHPKIEVYDRTVLYGGQIEDRDKDTGEYHLHEDKVGDVVCALSWLPDARETGAWAFLWPAVSGRPSKADRRVVTREGGSVYEASGFDYTPILGGKGYPADGDFKRKQMPPGETPASWPSFPTGYVLAVVAGTDTGTEHPVVLSADPRLVAVNFRGDPTMSTTVVDLKDPNEIDDERQAPLHSFWRVIKEPRGAVDFGPRNPLAWQLARGGQDGSTGWGMIYAELEPGGGPATTPSAPTSGGGGTVYAAPAGTAPRTGGTGAKGAKCGIGVTSNKGHGPFKLGTADDQHIFGHDADGTPIMSTHLDTDAYWHLNRDKDGPMYFERQKWPNPPDLPFQSLVHLVFDPAMSHPSLGRSGNGRWRWYSSYSMGATPTKRNTPVSPPTTPGDPVPPGTPVPPDAPTTGDGPTTGGGGGPPTSSPSGAGSASGGGTPSIPRPAPETPSYGPDGGGGWTDSSGRFHPPVGQDGKQVGSGPVVTPDNPSPVTPDDPSPNGYLPPDADPSFPFPLDPRGWGYGTGPGSGVDPQFPFPLSPDGRNRARAWTPEDGARPVMGAVTEHAFPAVLFRPQSLNGGATDLRRLVSPSPQDVARENTRPVVARLEAWGPMVAGEWGLTHVGDGRGLYGFSASGGVLVTVPEQNLSDADDDFSTPDRDLSRSYFAVAPGVYFGAGMPNTSTGDLRTGYRWGGSSGSLVFEALDASSTPQTALTLDTNGGTILGGKFALAGVLTAPAISSHQNDFNPVGMVRAGILRLSSTAAYNVTGLAGGADDRMLVVTNVGAFAITLKNADASSSAANRFLFGADLVLAAEESVWLTYDNTSARWRLVSRTTAASAGTVTSVDVSGGTTGLTTSGGPVTGSGTITIGGTLGVANGGTGSTTAGGARSALGVGTGDSPQFTGIELGHATDTTLARVGAGDVSIEGNLIYRAGGTDVPLTDGGTGASDAAGARTNLGLGGAAVLAVGTTPGTVAAGDDSRFTDARTPKLIEHTDAQTDIVNDSSEQTLWSKSITSMAAGDRVAVEIVGDYLNNSGAGRTLTVKVKFGSTTLLSYVSTSFAANASRRSVLIRFTLAAYGATNAQRAGGECRIGAASNAATGTGQLAPDGAAGTFKGGTASEDTTSAKTLSVTVQHSTNDANLSARLEFATATQFKA